MVAGLPNLLFVINLYSSELNWFTFYVARFTYITLH